jgi:general secretion pathway protein D
MALPALITALGLLAYAESANDVYKKGARAERKEDLDAAYEFYKQAYTREPNNAKYFASYTSVRFRAATKHVHAGQLLRNTGALAEAVAEFQRAVAIDSSSFIAQQELRSTADMIRRQERLKSAPRVEPPPVPLTEAIGESVELQPLSGGAITLHITANADAVYKTLGKLAGLNVLIDPDYRAQKLTVDLNNVTLRDALDMVRLQSKTFWRPVLPNTIFVAADSPAKRKELEQNVMKTFYLRNISSPAELQEAANTVRQILDVSRVQLLQAQAALILRGTPDQMVLAEKLLDDIDKPKSEVIIDVAVLQVSRDRMRTLGTNPPTTVNFGIVPTSIGGSSSGSGSGSSSGGFVKSVTNLASGSFVISVPGGATASLLASDSNSRILQNPQIRALNDQKATLRIGDRVPIATGSFQPGIVGGGGVSPLISTQFQYLDVGVNIDITPHIHSNQEVTLKMVLEISSVTGSENVGGFNQPIIGQRRIEHETRIADGDVNLLGGMLEETETQSLSGYPWVSKLPILRYLFAQENRERRDNEIVFAISPHIVRAQDITQENLRAIEIGTGSSIEVRRKSSPHVSPTPDQTGNPTKPR